VGHHRILGRVPYEPPQDPRQARRTAIWRWVSFVMALSLVALVAYLAYLGYDGSQAFAVHARSGDCRTPASEFGWPYEAINYDLASDSELDAFPDRTDCPRPGEEAGDDLTASDGIRIAGWYIPAGSQSEAAPTIVLAHGNGKTKSEMLSWAEPLHAEYNLVLFDFRNHGQSSGDVTTLGVREVRDLQAVVDWVERTKAPPAIAVLGVSMGGAAAIDEAATDERVSAVILDSTHATLVSALQAQLESRGLPLALPGAWSILLGGLLRTGEDLSVADPIQAIARIGDRPVLIVEAGDDDAVGPTDAADLMTAGLGDGARVELKTCPAAGHGGSVVTCSSDYASWVLGFLERSLPHGP
jgi:pimeloyl-ACP methyl ester carboxylesterase